MVFKVSGVIALLLVSASTCCLEGSPEVVTIELVDTVFSSQWECRLSHKCSTDAETWPHQLGLEIGDGTQYRYVDLERVVAFRRASLVGDALVTMVVEPQLELRSCGSGRLEALSNG